MVNRKLGRTSAHRNALFRNQLSSLIDRERIITTLPNGVTIELNFPASEAPQAQNAAAAAA